MQLHHVHWIGYGVIWLWWHPISLYSRPVGHIILLVVVWGACSSIVNLLTVVMGSVQLHHDFWSDFVIKRVYCSTVVKGFYIATNRSVLWVLMQSLGGFGWEIYYKFSSLLMLSYIYIYIYIYIYAWQCIYIYIYMHGSVLCQIKLLLTMCKVWYFLGTYYVLNFKTFLFHFVV